MFCNGQMLSFIRAFLFDIFYNSERVQRVLIGTRIRGRGRGFPQLPTQKNKRGVRNIPSFPRWPLFRTLARELRNLEIITTKCTRNDAQFLEEK